MNSYAEFFGRSRRPIALFIAIVSLFALWGVARLEFDDQPRTIFASEDELYSRLLELQSVFGSDDNDALLVFESDDWFQPATLNLLKDAAERVGAVEGVGSVTWMGAVPVFPAHGLPRQLSAFPAVSLPEREALRVLALEHPLVGERLLSDDGRVTLVVAHLAEEILAVEAIEVVVKELRALAAEFSRAEGVRVRVTGIPPIRVDIFGAIAANQVRFMLIGGVLCCLVSLFLFRSIGAVLCTSLPPLLGAFWAMGFIGLVGERINLLTAVLQMLVIVIALTDSVHLMIDVRLARGRGVGRVPSVVDAIRHLGLPCALTSLTTAVGFGSLAVARVPIIQGFGLLAAAGVLLAFVAVITSMPLLMCLLPSVGEVRDRERSAGRERVLELSLGMILARPRSTLVVGGLATLVLLYSTLNLQPENRLTEALPHGPAFDALRLCEESFGGSLPNYVLATWDEGLELESDEVLGTLGEVERLLEGIEHMGKPFSCLTLLEALPTGLSQPARGLGLIPPRLLEKFARRDARMALVVALVPDGGSDMMLPLYDEIEAGLRDISGRHSGMQLYLTGTDFVARSNVNGMIEDLLRSLALATLVIFGVIALEFRSLAWGAISLLPNFFPLVLVGGALSLVGAPLQISSALLFTVLLGLAVDDTIHFLARYRRELADGLAADPEASGAAIEHRRAAIRSAYMAVGRAILVTTLVLTVGFGVVGFSEIPIYQLFAGSACLGLVGALAGDLLLLPALLLLFDRRGARGVPSR